MPLRLLMLVLLACGVVGTPLASALDEVHALGHADFATHDVHDDVGVDAASDTAGDEDLLHALAHCGHCHGHGSVLPTAPLPTLPALHTQACPESIAQPALRSRIDILLRPPIV